MNLSKKHIKSNQDGRSLLEIILVIIIMCLLTLGGMYLYNYSVDNRNADLIYEDILVHSEHLRNKGKARNKSVYDSSLGDYTRTGSNIRSKVVNEHSKIFTVTVENLTTDLCSAFSQKSWPEERVARILLNDTEYSPNSINCEDIENEDAFDLGVVFWSNLANEEDKKNPFILPSLCQDGCLECQKCENNVCVNDDAVCSGNSVCVKTSSRPQGECKVLCNSNEYYDGRSCQPCPTHAICDGSPDYDCESGYYKTDAGECMLCPPMVGVSSCDSGGLICLDGYYKKNGACQLCPEPNRTYCQSEPSHNKNSDGCPMYRYEECSLGKSCVNNTCVCSPESLPLGSDCSECAYSCVSGLSCENGVCVGEDPNIGEECQPACSSDQSCRSGQCVCNDDGSQGSSCSVNCPCDSGLECQDKNASGVGVCRQEEDNECGELPTEEMDSCTSECGCGNDLYCTEGYCMSDYGSITCDDGKEVVCNSRNVCECQCSSILICTELGEYLEVHEDCIQEATGFYWQETGPSQYLCCTDVKPSALGEYCYSDCGGCSGQYVCNSDGGGYCCPTTLPSEEGEACHVDCGCDGGLTCANEDSSGMGTCQNTCSSSSDCSGEQICNTSTNVCECGNNKTEYTKSDGTIGCCATSGYTIKDLVSGSGQACCKNTMSAMDECNSTCSCGSTMNCKDLNNDSVSHCCAKTLPGENASCYEDCGCATGFTCSDVNSSTGMGICKQSKEVCCEKCGENQYCTSSDSYATCSCGNCGSLPASVGDTCYVDCGCSGDMDCTDDNNDGVGTCSQSCPSPLPDEVGDSCLIGCGCGSIGGNGDYSVDDDDNLFCDWYENDHTKGLCSTYCELSCYEDCIEPYRKPCRCQLDGNCPETLSTSCSTCGCPDPLPNTTGALCYMGCGCGGGLTCEPDETPNTVYEKLQGHTTSYKGTCQGTSISDDEDLDCTGECCQAMVNAGLSRCSDTKTSNCFTVVGNTVYYKGTSDMSFSKTTTVPSCNLNITDARLYISSNVELTVNDINLTNKVSTSSKGIYLNSRTSILNARDIVVETNNSAIDSYGDIVARNITATSENASAIYSENDEAEINASENITAYCKRDGSYGYWGIYAIGPLVAGGNIHAESLGSAIHAAQGIRAGGYIKGIGGSVGGVEGTTDGGYGLDLSDGEVNAGGDLIGISHGAGIYLYYITSMNVGGDLIGRNEWGSGHQGFEINQSSDAIVTINGDVDIFCANGAAHNHTTSYGACFYNQSHMTVGGDLTSINEREYRDNYAIRNWGYLSVGGNVTASSQDDAIAMAGANVGVAKLYVGGNITATSVDQDGIEMNNAAVIHTTNGSIRATGYLGIEIGGNCEIIAGCDPKRSICSSLNTACTGDVTGSIVAIGEYHGIHCDNSTAVIQASGDVVGIATDDKYKNEQGLYSWGTVSAGQCIYGQGYYGIYAYPGQGMGCPSNGAPFYSAPSIVANGVRHDIVLKCNNINNVSCTGVGHAYSYSKALANGCCYYWSDDKTCMSSPQ